MDGEKVRWLLREYGVLFFEDESDETLRELLTERVSDGTIPATELQSLQ
jgi:hypothetical protein